MTTVVLNGNNVITIKEDLHSFMDTVYTLSMDSDYHFLEVLAIIPEYGSTYPCVININEIILMR